MTFFDVDENTKEEQAMARAENDTAFKEVIEVILQNGLEGLPEALSIIINETKRQFA